MFPIATGIPVEDAMRHCSMEPKENSGIRYQKGERTRRGWRLQRSYQVAVIRYQLGGTHTRRSRGMENAVGWQQMGSD